MNQNMKKLVSLLLGIFICASMFAQDIILKRDNTIIPAIVEEISDSEVVYRSYDNPDGPRYRVSKDNIAQIKFQNGTSQIFEAPAPAPAPSQYGSPYTPSYLNASARMEASRGELELGGRELSDNEILELLGSEGLDEFESAKRQRRMGLGFICAGAPVFVIGDILLTVGAYRISYYKAWYVSYDGGDTWTPTGENDFSERYDSALPLLISGAVISAAGIAFLGAGIPSMIVGNRRINNLADDYNKKQLQNTTLSFGPTASGLGLTLKF